MLLLKLKLNTTATMVLLSPPEPPFTIYRSLELRLLAAHLGQGARFCRQAVALVNPLWMIALSQLFTILRSKQYLEMVHASTLYVQCSDSKMQLRQLRQLGWL
jgi:hypothetical protein